MSDEKKKLNRAELIGCFFFEKQNNVLSTGQDLFFFILFHQENFAKKLTKFKIVLTPFLLCIVKYLTLNFWKGLFVLILSWEIGLGFLFSVFWARFTVFSFYSNKTCYGMTNKTFWNDSKFSDKKVFCWTIFQNFSYSVFLNSFPNILRPSTSTPIQFDS